MTLQITEIEPLKDGHQHPKTLPQDQTTLVHGDCNPHKKRKKKKTQPKQKIQENIKKLQQKYNHSE